MFIFHYFSSSIPWQLWYGLSSTSWNFFLLGGPWNLQTSALIFLAASPLVSLLFYTFLYLGEIGIHQVSVLIFLLYFLGDSVYHKSSSGFSIKTLELLCSFDFGINIPSIFSPHQLFYDLKLDNKTILWVIHARNLIYFGFMPFSN